MNASRFGRASVFVASAGILAALLCSGCAANAVDTESMGRTPESVPSEPPLPSASEFGAPGAPGCEPASPIVLGEALATSKTPEVSAFGMLFLGVDGLTRDEQLKVVVRITGSGDFAARLRDPDGKAQPLGWGPEDHFGSSSYARPGDEWGMGLDFDQPGCWNLQLFRGSEHVADFWLPIT